MKTLKTNKLLLAVILNQLYTITTKDLKNIDEIEKYINVKKKIEDVLSDYTELFKERSEFSRNIRSKKINPEKQKQESKKLNDKFLKLDDEGREKQVELKLENPDFNFLFDLYLRKGKEFFTSPDRFIEFKKDLDKTNQQSKK